MSIDALIAKLQHFATRQSSGSVDEDDTAEGSQQQREAAQQVADELLALQSIFGEESIELLILQNPQGAKAKGQAATPHRSETHSIDWRPDEPIRIAVTVNLDVGDNNEDGELTSIKLSATLPIGYPLIGSPPQLQLLSRYIGSHGVDHILFGRVLRIYHSGQTATGQAIFQEGEVALFDGIERVRDAVEEWYSEREASKLQSQSEDDAHQQDRPMHLEQKQVYKISSQVEIEEARKAFTPSVVTLYTAPEITERKSVFVGHAAILTSVSRVPLIISEVLKDRRVSRATHPAIYAWVCREEGQSAVQRDCDDDGETAAGGRLAHLLDLLHLENVMVVVTRWYGGVQLGPDRFKLINRAARDALELAQLVAGPLNPGTPANKHRSKR